MSHRSCFYSLLLTVVLASACSNESANTNTEFAKLSTDSPVVEAKIAEKISADPHKAHRRKPGADVSLVDNVVHKLEPGVDAELVVELATAYQQGEMAVTLAASEGLLILDGSLTYTFTLDKANSYSMPLRVMATDAGRYYIHIQAVVTHEGRQTARALSTIVQVGSELVMDKKLQKADGSGSVIPLPAQETIIQE